MTKKILRSIVLVAGTVLLASVVIIMGCLYEYFGSLQEMQLRDELGLAAVLTEARGEEGLRQVDASRFRLTWIDADGKVQWTDAFNMIKAEGKEVTRNFGTAAVFPFRCSLDAYWNTLSEYAYGAIQTWAATNDKSGILPALTFTAEEAEEMTDWMADIKTYMEENYAGLVNGAIAIDQIPEIQNKLKSMHIERILEIYQAAYERYRG